LAANVSSWPQTASEWERQIADPGMRVRTASLAAQCLQMISGMKDAFNKTNPIREKNDWASLKTLGPIVEMVKAERENKKEVQNENETREG